MRNVIITVFAISLMVSTAAMADSILERAQTRIDTYWTQHESDSISYQEDIEDQAFLADHHQVVNHVLNTLEKQSKIEKKINDEVMKDYPSDGQR